MPTISKDRVNDATGIVPEGWHRCRVSDCQPKRATRTEDHYYNLALETPTGRFIGYDVAMLEGRGNGIGIAKLMALGACADIGDEYDYELPGDVKGKEGYVYVRHEEYDGKTRCKVDIREGKCGYLPLDEPPQGLASEPYEEPDPGADPDEDIPF